MFSKNGSGYQAFSAPLSAANIGHTITARHARESVQNSTRLLRRGCRLFPGLFALPDPSSPLMIGDDAVDIPASKRIILAACQE
jgi:hypothetical protein